MKAKGKRGRRSKDDCEFLKLFVIRFYSELININLRLNPMRETNKDTEFWHKIFPNKFCGY